MCPGKKMCCVILTPPMFNLLSFCLYVFLVPIAHQALYQNAFTKRACGLAMGSILLLWGYFCPKRRYDGLIFATLTTVVLRLLLAASTFPICEPRPFTICCFLRTASLGHDAMETLHQLKLHITMTITTGSTSVNDFVWKYTCLVWNFDHLVDWKALKYWDATSIELEMANNASLQRMRARGAKVQMPRALHPRTQSRWRAKTRIAASSAKKSRHGFYSPTKSSTWRGREDKKRSIHDRMRRSSTPEIAESSHYSLRRWEH